MFLNAWQSVFNSDRLLSETSHPTLEPVDLQLKLPSSQLKLTSGISQTKGLSPGANLNPGSGFHTAVQLFRMHGKCRRERINTALTSIYSSMEHL